MFRESKRSCWWPGAAQASRFRRRTALALLAALAVPALVGGHEHQAKADAAGAGHAEQGASEHLFSHQPVSDNEESAGQHGAESGGHGEGPHGEHEGAEEEEGEEHEEEKHIDIAIGCMLLGSIAMQMGLLYLLNYPDDDIMKASWEVISNTISIFVSVLIFHSVIGIVEYIEEGGEVRPGHDETGSAAQASGWIPVAHTTISLCVFLAFFTVMHCLIFSEVSADRPEGEPSATTRSLSVPTDETPPMVPQLQMRRTLSTEETSKQRRKRITKSWSILLSHISSFAGIHFGVHIQSLEIFAQFPASTILVPILLMGFLFGLFRLTDWLRARNSENLDFEVHEDWDDEAEEAEKEITAIAVSFLLIQAIRFCISGELAGANGLDTQQRALPWGCVAAIMATGLLFYGLTAIMVGFIAWEATKKMGNQQKEEAEKAAEVSKSSKVSQSSTLVLLDVEHAAHAGLDPMDVYVERWYKMAPKITACAGSWCFLWACKWGQRLIPQIMGIQFSYNSTVMLVALSLFISLAMFVVILGLDWVADLEFTGPICDVTIRAIIDSLGVLVGFTWELSFMGGLENISELSRGLGSWGPLLCQILLAVCISIIVIPAWRKNILRRVMQLKEMEATRVAHERSPLSHSRDCQEELPCTDADSGAEDAHPQRCKEGKEAESLMPPKGAE